MRTATPVPHPRLKRAPQGSAAKPAYAGWEETRAKPHNTFSLTNRLRRLLRRPPAPRQVDALEGYARWAATYEQDMDGHPLALAESGAMLSLLPECAGLVALDAACGTGRYARLLAERGARQVIGVDQSAAMLERARAGCPTLAGWKTGGTPFPTLAGLETGGTPFPTLAGLETGGTPFPTLAGLETGGTPFPALAGLETGGTPFPALADWKLALQNVLEFRKGDLLALPLDDASCDLAVVALALAHLETTQLAWAFAELRRVLRPGGVLLMSEMHPFGALTGGRCRFEQGEGEGRQIYHIQTHTHLHEDYLAAADSAGFRLEALREPRLTPDLFPAFERAGMGAFARQFAGFPLALVCRWRVAERREGRV